MKNYLIPANAKRSMLIFGLFNTFDLIMFGTGLGVTIILLLILPINEMWAAVIGLAPAVITGFLVIPVPNYHNILTVIKSAVNFFMERREFIWKGWCYPHGEKK